MEKNLGTYGDLFQMSILKLMCEDELFCARSCHYLKPEYFTGDLKWFFKKAKDHYRIYGPKSLPNYAQFNADIYQLETGSIQKYLDILDKIFKITVPVEKFKKELTGFIRANMYIAGYQKAAASFNVDNKETAYEVTLNAVQEIMKVDFERDRVTRFGDVWDVLDIVSAQKKDAIPTGIMAIDEAMGGGLFPQTWTTFIGPSNVGKSMLNPSLAYFAMLKGKRTFVTVHEDEEYPTKLRYLSRFSGIPFNKLLLGRSILDDVEKERVELADKVLKEFVTLRFMYGHEATVEKVSEAARLQMLEQRFDLFICDYGQCLGIENKSGVKFEKKYDLQEEVYYQLKQLCLELNIAGAGGAQTNRQGHAMARTGADFLRVTDVGDSFGIVKKSSNVITMNRSTEAVQNNRIVFLLDKVRNGRCPVAVECVTDYSCCTTHMEDGEGENRLGKQVEIPVTGGPDSEREDEGKEA